MNDASTAAPTPTLLQAASDFGTAVRKLSEAKQVSQVLSQLSTRRQELLERVALTASTVTAFQLIPNEVRDGLPPFDIESLHEKLKSLAERFNDDPTVITRPRAFDARSFDTTLDRIRSTIASVWSQWVTTTDAAIALHLIDNADWFEEFRELVASIRLIQGQIQKLAERLPVSSDDVEQVRQAKSKLQEAVSELVAKGLDDDKLDFLQQSGGQGFALEDLLADTELTDWLRQCGLLRYCAVQRRNKPFE